MGTEGPFSGSLRHRLLHHMLRSAEHLVITFRDCFHGLSTEWHITGFILRFMTIEASALCIHYSF